MARSSAASTVATRDERPAKDRWHELDDAIDASNLAASDKAVYHQLLKRADYGTGELPPKYTPTRKTIARAASLSVSQVGYATRHLERHDWLKRLGKTGPGKPLSYRLSAGEQCHCTGRVHVPTVSTEPATVPTVDTEQCQPTVSTLHVNGTIPLRGTEREAVERQVERKLSFAEVMAASGSDPWR